MTRRTTDYHDYRLTHIHYDSLMRKKQPKSRAPDATSKTVATAICRIYETTSAGIAVSEADVGTTGVADAVEKGTSTIAGAALDEVGTDQGLLLGADAMHTAETATDMYRVAAVVAGLVTGPHDRLLDLPPPTREARCRGLTHGLTLARGAGPDRVPTASLAAGAVGRGRLRDESATGQAGATRKLLEETHHLRRVGRTPEVAGLPRQQIRSADTPGRLADRGLHHGGAIGACLAGHDRGHGQDRLLQHEPPKLKTSAPIGSSSAVVHLVTAVEG